MQSNSIPFCKDYLKAHASPPVIDLLDELELLEFSDFPSPEVLNELTSKYYKQWKGPTFKGQSQFSESEKRYYETIISEDGVVPTREQNWHDLFNALIWLQFPKTKSLLNELHISDINEYGVNPRTVRRNRITHFDECGVVLAIEEPSQCVQPPDSLKKATQNHIATARNDESKKTGVESLEAFLQQLAEHEWEEAFLANRERWHAEVTPFIFGHANLEMMLNPFIGLTGKWLAVAVPHGFSKLDKWQQRGVLDDAMSARISALDAFKITPLLKPLPLLGVPFWHSQQDVTFYQNKEYFRPLRQGTKPTKQLPLWA